MAYDPDKHHRRSIRLKNYDYSWSGMYFVTICVQNRELLFGKIVGDEMHLNEAGQMVQSVWGTLPERFSNFESDEFVVMPNHFHGILIIKPERLTEETKASIEEGTSLVDVPASIDSMGTLLDTFTLEVSITNENEPETAPSLGDAIGALKSMTTHKYIQGVRQHDWAPFDRRLWQRNYWEHIIRNEMSLNEIRGYICNNPASWVNDRLHPDAPPNKFNQ